MGKTISTNFRNSASCLMLALAIASPLFAASDDAPQPEVPTASTTLFPHSAERRWWVSGQANVIFQAHPDFHADYSGEYSLQPQGEHATSMVESLYLGYRLGRGSEVLATFEEAAGGGLSNALGLAGFTNLDVVRNPYLSKGVYLGRLVFHQTIALSGREVEQALNPVQGITVKVPERRLELRVGKMGTADFFDQNSVGSDSHLQFMNWTVDNNGAYDYAADTRGYTNGVEVEYQSARWALRVGEMLMPQVANGNDLEWNLRRAHAENYELELRPQLLAGRHSVVRLLGFENHANMGTYSQAVARYRAGVDKTPTIENTRRPGTVKYGFGLNAEQEVGRGVRAFGRLGWNEGQHESFAYTEVDATASAGADLAGGAWHRGLDKVGVAMVTNGISRWHQEYLRLGGHGFLLGDGGLNYGRENIVEAYYTLHAWRGVFLGADLQRVWNPGYNRARGPVVVPGLRLHVEL